MSSSGDAHLGNISLTLRCIVDDYKHDYGNDYAHYDDDNRNKRDALREWTLVNLFSLRAKVFHFLWGSRGDICVSLCFCSCCCRRVGFRLLCIDYALVVSDDKSELSNCCSGLLAIESNHILVGRKGKVSALVASA